ncbi:FAD-dependent monooxygenase [Aestuariivirga sp.]|uniref:FAD-dependent monooxygenase n=1 Tax=Aestuariivirga sp. TaxID=2650926 RepID=UPI003918BA26
MEREPFLVAGGGIAGLAAALALARHAGPVRLFEQAAAFEEVGAGLQMSPNGVGALRALGAWEDVEPSCVIPSEIHVRDGVSGRLLQRIRLGRPFEERFGAPYRVCHRSDLLAGLLAAARRHGTIELNTAQRAVSARQSGDSVTLEFAGGSAASGSGVIAADGIRSSLRALVCGEVAPVARGSVIWRGLIPLGKVPPEIEADCVTLWLCPGGHVVHYPVSNWRSFNIVAAADGAVEDGGWQTPAPSSEVVRRFAVVWEELGALLATPDTYLRWPAADLPPLPVWSRGRLALIGDAAHATLPYLAQGAVMSLEDAVVLARELARFDSLPEGFAAYEQARKPRTARIQEQSRGMSRVYHAAGPLALARNLVLGFGSPSLALRRLEWIYRWTPEAAA